MLYVFHVDTGRMLNFEMSKALENVRSLKETIERHYGIPSVSVVLLVSGGEMLLDSNRVCNYTAGTDTNPIYMFSTCLLDVKNQPPPWPSIETDNDLKAQVDRCLDLPATYGTVVTRAALAQKIYEKAKEEAKTCETLVHEQHLQQQGWAAVVANMEDVVNEFQDRVADFYRRYEEHRQRYKEHVDILSSFDKDVKQLSEIPILSSLMENADSRPFGVFDEVYADACITATSTSSGSVKMSGIESTSTGSVNMPPSEQVTEKSDGACAVTTTDETTLSASEKKIGISLLDWISADKGQSALKRMATECLRGLGQFENTAMQNLKENVDRAAQQSQREDMKEIKGLERRLCDLERKMFEARKLVQDQNELAQSFQQNQIRASTLGDTSILPDLCASHQSQLLVMLKNQKELHEIRRQCIKSKDELGNNLFIRLSKFIIPVETRVYEIDNSLLFYHTCLKRLQKHLGIIEQIHMAPSMYVSAVTEVVRRRMFSSSFLRWASDLACRLMTIYNEEVMRRHEFSSQFEGHFLSTLFPGMDDMPPTYAIQAPSTFDSSLPALNKQDLQELSRFLPQLTEKIQLPNIDSVIDFFSSRSVDGTQSKSSGLQEFRAEMGEAVSASGRSINDEKTSDSANNAQLQTKEGCESETDTEEFEKVGQSPVDRRRKLRPKVETCSLATSTDQVLLTSAGTLTEENLGTTRLEVEKLKSILRNVYQLSQSSISFLREQLSALKSENAARQVDFRSKLEAINKCWTVIQKETRNRERETIQRLTVDHELEMNDLRKSIHLKDDEIQSLRSDNVMIKASHIETVSKYESEKKELNEKIDEMKEVVSKLEKQLADVDVDKRKAIQEAVEQLEHNPADVVSRGALPEDLLQHELWWNSAPELWEPQLLEDSSEPLDESKLPEVKEDATVLAVVKAKPSIDLARCSNYRKMQRAWVYVDRYINLVLHKGSTTSNITADEMARSEKNILMVLQQQEFGDLLKLLKAKANVRHPLSNLAPFLGDDGLIRVGGRLKYSAIPYEGKHQVLLPERHHVTTILIRKLHEEHFHVGQNGLLAIVRERYWPLRAKAVIKQVISKCQICAKQHPRPGSQFMGNLPEVRVNPAPPFSKVGIDYAGPIMLKTGGRGSKLAKAYVVVFVCMVVKAIHFELVSNLSTDNFIASLQRFSSRRGLPSDIFSDNATCFVGANHELAALRELFNNQQHQHKLDEFCSLKGIRWHFIPPRSPHFGGIWEAGVKSMKHHMKRVIGETKLTYEEMTTFLAQTETILNSRPLFPMSEDPNDMAVLTPSHFLINRSAVALPEPSYEDEKIGRLSRWQHVQVMQQHFWRRWSREYLHHLQCRQKWHDGVKEFKVGALVMLVEENLPPQQWRRGRIIATHPGDDGAVRVVTVKTSSSTFKRAITKVALLPSVEPEASTGGECLGAQRK